MTISAGGSGVAGTSRASLAAPGVPIVDTADAHDAAIDQAYRATYGNGSALQSITNASVTGTTLRLDPR